MDGSHCGLAPKECLLEILSENLGGRVSPDKTQFNQVRLIFFDDVVHAIAFSPCGKLLAVGGQVKAPTVFLVQDFQKATLSCAQSCLVTILSLSCFWSEDMQVTVRDVPAVKVVFQVERLVSHVSFSSDGSSLATACFGRSVVVLSRLRISTAWAQLLVVL